MLSSIHDALFSGGEFLQKTLDCLRSHIAILNSDGKIIAVNATWKKFAASNGLAQDFCGPGANYLRSCDRADGECSDEAFIVAAGIRDVVARKREHFYLEYPCHSPDEQRWFSVRITRFEIGSQLMVVVAHDNITQRKLAEIDTQEANRQLGKLAVTDGLTGIANRRSFDIVFEVEWKRHERMQTPLSVALFDIDCFKQFNDYFGHVAGDECLRTIAQTFQSRAERAGDFVARFGGEEFAIIFPTTESLGAATVLQEIQRSIRDLAIAHPSSKVQRKVVTVSIGCATIVPSAADSAVEFLERADQALYEAKRKGRDRLVCVERAACAI